MKATPCAIADVLLIEPRVFGDERGFFFESFNRRAFAQRGALLNEPAQRRETSARPDQHQRHRRVLRRCEGRIGTPQIAKHLVARISLVRRDVPTLSN